MAYTVPTAADLKARFPTFAAVADSIVTTALAEAAVLVDDSWSSQEDFTLARLLYAAHTLTLDGHGSGAEAAMAAEGTLGFQTIKSGELTLIRGSKAAPEAFSTTQDSQYGKRFEEVRRRNVGGPLVVTS